MWNSNHLKRCASPRYQLSHLYNTTHIDHKINPVMTIAWLLGYISTHNTSFHFPHHMKELQHLQMILHLHMPPPGNLNFNRITVPKTVRFAANQSINIPEHCYLFIFSQVPNRRLVTYHLPPANNLLKVIKKFRSAIYAYRGLLNMQYIYTQEIYMDWCKYSQDLIARNKPLPIHLICNLFTVQILCSPII